MAKAKKENRLIFIDAYTDYCQPCMLMVKNVFSLNDVADFYNRNFINLKIHFGKEKELAEKYGTSGYRHSCLSMVMENWFIWRVDTRKEMSLSVSVRRH